MLNGLNVECVDVVCSVAGLLVDLLLCQRLNDLMVDIL